MYSGRGRAVSPYVFGQSRRRVNVAPTQTKFSKQPPHLRVRTTILYMYMYPAPGRGNAVGEITGPAALPARQGAGTPCPVNTDSLTNDPDPRLTVGANMHTCLLRPRRTVGANMQMHTCGAGGFITTRPEPKRPATLNPKWNPQILR